MAMKLKLDDAGHAVLKDGNPIYIHDDGKEIPFDAAATVSTISRLNGEAKSHREGKEAAEERLKAFSAIQDPAAAVKALEIVSNLDTKKLIDAGQVDKVKEEAKKAFDAQLLSIQDGFKPVLAERDSLKQSLVNEKIGGSFARSPYIKEKLAIPAELVQAYFGQSFKLEGDKVVAYDREGKQIFSRLKPGNVAEFDEALEIQIDGSPFRDNILKGTGAHGSGAGGGGGAGANGKKALSRPAFESLEPAARMVHIKDGGTVFDAA